MVRGLKPGKKRSTTKDLQGEGSPSHNPPFPYRALTNSTSTFLGFSLSTLNCQLLTRNDAERLGHLGQDVHCTQQLLALVRRADHGAQPRFAFRYDRVTDGRRKDTRFKKFL